MAQVLAAWDKEQYVNWLRTRDADPAKWKRAECIQADRLIEREALAALETHLRKMPKPLAEFVRVCAKAHFGSMETDDMLQALDCYPDWMEKRS